MKIKDIIEIARKYYRRHDVARAIANYSKNREVVAKYYDKFGRRPDAIEYENDIMYFAENNATSFHCSVELWKDPLSLAKDLQEEKLNELRIGWDLLIDIDCPFVDYSKEAAKLIIKSLEWHGINNYGIKYSGGKGFHIVLSNNAFPDSIKYKDKEIAIKDFFPVGPRIIASYLSDFIEKELREVILSLSSIENIAKATGKNQDDLMIGGKFNPYSIVGLDTVLMSSRHLYRMPYSLHEKTGLVSTVINKQQLNAFNLNIAKPSAVIIKQFLKKANAGEANELLVNALDWKEKEKIMPGLEQLKANIKEKYAYSDFKPIAITKDISNAYCGCIKKILEGMKQDGRKRALFILITYFRSLGFDFARIEDIIKKWNEKNYRPLKEPYIKGQLNWYKKQTKAVLPPNHDATAYYKDIGILSETCSQSKNPVAYTARVLRQMARNEDSKKKGQGRKRRRQ